MERPVEKVPVSKLADDLDPGGKARIFEKALELDAGVRITAWLSALFGAGLIASVLITLSGRPDLGTAGVAPGTTATLADYTAARQAWFDNAVRLLNIFVQPILTVVASVVGFTIGARRAQ